MRKIIGPVLAGALPLGVLAVPASAGESTLAELEAAVVATRAADVPTLDQIAPGPGCKGIANASDKAKASLAKVGVKPHRDAA